MLTDHPRYTLVRGVARFPAARALVQRTRARVQRSATRAYLAERRGRVGVVSADREAGPLVADLCRDGFATGLAIPPATVEALLRFAEGQTLYADRDRSLGFDLDRRADAERALGKPILVAQYLNASVACPEIAALGADPLLEAIAAEFLGSVPQLVGSSLWWTFPVDADDADRSRHAHLFHRDVDDFAFVKFFFYVTDVEPDDGGHVCVRGSHLRTAVPGSQERLRLRRYTDEEVTRHHGAERIVEITGAAGTGFAENTLCLHKGLTPQRSARLLLQFEFALFDHGVMHDVVAPSALGRIDL